MNKQDLYQAKNDRFLAVEAAEKALGEGNTQEYDKQMELVKGFNAKIQQLEEMLEEKARFGDDPDDKGAFHVEKGGRKADGFSVIAKMLRGQSLGDVEKDALVTGTNSEHGETYLVPDDVRAEINELRKSYVSAKDLVTVETTDALAGSVTYESGTPAGLADFDDGDAISEETGVGFVLKKFSIAWKGKLIPISRILLSSAKAALMNYLNRWFLRNAIISENEKIFETLKTGYNSGTPKAVAGWKELKKSITVDLDPSCLVDGVIVTNQSGFACLDEEEDADGRPVLRDNPQQPTEKMFQGLPVLVFPDTHLANIDSTHFPMIYGSLKAGATFVEHKDLEFAVSEHFLFNKNQNCLRVIEGFDVMSTDTGAYVYGSFSASDAASG